MNKKKKYDQLIDQYAFNSNSNVEGLVFDGKEENSLADEVQFRKKLITDFENNEVLVLKQRLESIHTAYSKEDKKKKSVCWRYILLALGLGALAYYFSSKNMSSAPNPTQMYAMHFEPLKMNQAERTIDDIAYQSLQSNYNAGNYDAAIVQLNNYLKDSDDPQLRIFRGICLLKRNKISEARVDLKQVSNSENLFWKDHADWYLALSYLKTEQIDEARQLLNRLSIDKNADHHMRAKEILSEL